MKAALDRIDPIEHARPFCQDPDVAVFNHGFLAPVRA